MKSLLQEYDVIWESPSESSKDVMPCGGHDLALTIWVEKNEILFYLGKGGSFDENNQMLTLGRGRIQFEEGVFLTQNHFCQHLHLEEGWVEVSVGKGEERVIVQFWCEIERPVAHVVIESARPIHTKASYEAWRLNDREMPKHRRHPSLSYMQYQGEVITRPDQVDFTGDEVQFYHRNESQNLLRDRLITQQNLDSVKDKIPDTQRNRTFGGKLKGVGFRAAGGSEGIYIKTPYRAWALQSDEKRTRHELEWVFHTAQTETLEDWLTELNKVDAASAQTWAAVKAWWRAFQDKSRIMINPGGETDDQAWQVGRNYQLFRHMLGCNSKGDYPTKFNGGFFITDPCHVDNLIGWEAGEDLSDETPDYRQWGGGSFTGQNQRLVYWPMLKSGDHELMPSQFDYYLRTLPAAKARCQEYWGHEGACFAEQLENFGLPIGWGWGWEGAEDESHTRFEGLDPTAEAGRWVRYYYETQLEFTLMLVEYLEYTREDISRWIPFMEESVAFFDAHFRFRCKQSTGQEFDGNGKYIFAPAKSLETYEDAVNPLPIIAALQYLTERLLAVPEDLFSSGERARWERIQKALPPLPTRQVKGQEVYSPAESYLPEPINNEDPQMYLVFPYRIARLGSPELEMAKRTWQIDDSLRRFKCCWGQSFLWVARMGLLEEAKELAIDKMANAPRRYPAFWGAGPDWVPDIDHGGSGMIGLQEMLMQCDDGKIKLFPTWPKEWEVDFKLHAPQNTVVEGVYRNGNLEKLVVTPSSRERDVVNLL